MNTNTYCNTPPKQIENILAYHANKLAETASKKTNITITPNPYIFMGIHCHRFVTTVNLT